MKNKQQPDNISEEQVSEKKYFDDDKVYEKNIHLKFVYTKGILFTLLCGLAIMFFSILLQMLANEMIKPTWAVAWMDEMKAFREEVRASENKEVLILTGSGTVLNYLNKIDRVGDNIAYNAIPSYFALKSLREEKRPDIVGGFPKKKYNWIVMSAERAGDWDVMGEKEAEIFKRKDGGTGKILECYLGDDTLKVMLRVKGIFEEEKYRNRDYITVQELQELYSRRSDYKLYRTSYGSATRMLYEKYLGKLDEDKTTFYDMHTKNFTDNKQFVILGSSFYLPDVKNMPASRDDWKAYSIREADTEKPIVKNMFLYFVAYWKDGQELCVPKVTKEFVEKYRNPKTKRFSFEDNRDGSHIQRDKLFEEGAK